MKFSKTGENVEKDNIIHFVQNWHECVAKSLQDFQGMINFPEKEIFLDLMSYFEQK